MNCSSFFTWIKREYRKKEGEFGDLARFIYQNRDRFANKHSYKNNRAWLEFSNPSPEMIDAFNRVWPEYEAYKRSRQHA